MVAIAHAPSWTGGMPRSEVIDEFHAAVVRGIPPVHDGTWAMATMEVCLAMRESAQRQQDVTLQHQVALGAAGP